MERLERGGTQSRVWRHVPAFLGKMVRGDRQGHIRRGGTVLSGTFGRQPQAFGGTGRLDIRRTRPQKQEQKHKKSNSMQENIISAAKTDVFRVRINPEIKQELESVYAKNGLTLTDAINVFFQQSLNAGGFPFAVTEDNAEIIKAKALSRLAKQLQEAQDDPVSYSEDEVYKMFGVEK